VCARKTDCLRTQVELWTDIQGKITTLSDKSLEQLFHLTEMQVRGVRVSHVACWHVCVVATAADGEARDSTCAVTRAVFVVIARLCAQATLQRLSQQDERFRAAASAFAHPNVSGGGASAGKPSSAHDNDDEWDAHAVKNPCLPPKRKRPNEWVLSFYWFFCSGQYISGLGVVISCLNAEMLRGSADAINRQRNQHGFAVHIRWNAYAYCSCDGNFSIDGRGNVLMEVEREFMCAL
jgi:hypothetical protein